MRTLLPGLLCCAASTVVSGQTPLPPVRIVDEVLGRKAGVRYYDAHWVPLPTGPAGAHCYDQFVRIDSAGLDWRARRYAVASGQLVLEQYFTGPVSGAILEGPGREWYETGQLREELTYHKHRIVGALRTYYPDGKPRRTQFFSPAKGSGSCLDSVGRPVAKCPSYHDFARIHGRSTFSGKFLGAVQRGYAAFLPAGYRQPNDLVVYYAFRIDPAGAVQDARLLTEAPDEVQAAIWQAVKQFPLFAPATLEGYPTDDIIEGYVSVKAVR